MEFGKLAEKRIEAAMEAGEMDDLILAGRPLPTVEAAGDAMEVAGFKMMARAGALPIEIQLKKQIATKWELFRNLEDESNKKPVMAEIGDLQMRLAIMLESGK